MVGERGGRATGGERREKIAKTTAPHAQKTDVYRGGGSDAFCRWRDFPFNVTLERNYRDLAELAWFLATGGDKKRRRTLAEGDARCFDEELANQVQSILEWV